MNAPVLEVQGITVRFGGVTAVSNVSFDVQTNEFVGLIGPNGAGKTTLLRTILGLNPGFSGRVAIDGRDVSRARVPDRIRCGLGLTHQIVRPFRNLSILENVTLAVGRDHTRSALRSIVSSNRARSASEARQLLAMVGIEHVADQSPATQPLGVLKRLEVARALGTRPRILLLDEPLAGLSSAEATKLADLLVELNNKGTTIVLIEHNLAEARRVCQRFVVLDNGRLLADGSVQDVLKDERVVTAYLGHGRSNA